MDLLPTSDQEQIVDAATQFLRRELPLDRFLATGGADAQHQWKPLGGLGWFALTLPESAGGAGLGLVEEALLHREFGRVLAPPATLGAALGARAALAAGRGELAAAIASGQSRVGLAVALGAGMHQLVDAAKADFYLGWDEHEARLWATADLGALVPLPSIDPGVALATAALDGVAPVLRASLPAFAAEANVLVAAQLCGLAEAARDLAVEYAKTRQQFGRAIGSFQAVKHPCADMAVNSEAAFSLLKLAALSVAGGRPDAAFQAAAAKLVALQAAYHAGRASIQIHGAMGFSVECAAHLFVKRVHILDAIGGDLHAQQARVLAASV